VNVGHTAEVDGVHLGLAAPAGGVDPAVADLPVSCKKKEEKKEEE